MLEQPVALVTGGSRGIGRGICVELARSGFAVCINYQGNERAARETQRLCDAVAHPHGLGSDICQADVGQAADRERLVQATLDRWQRLDVLVNNAGITSIGRLDILEATEESWDKVLGINLKGAFFLTQRVAWEMTRLTQSPPPNFQPTIVNISSVSAYALSTNRGDYCISKAGLSLATQLWALRLADFGIRVYEVRPGIIETDMTAAGKDKYDHLFTEGLTPIRRWGTPADVGKAVAALVTGALPYCTGEVINVDGGYHLRPFPR
ncbi:MAG: 3-ketoacyl-ACP reductase [Gemmataceae bacterium]|nr:3-ketoacyl-ACP reductase [Gemmataceae bacterium]MCI0738335.1 3-ketoacyl-ACP reductase [Gemmataceae bacterium]